MVHNHINPGRAVVITWDHFPQNEATYIDDKFCLNDPMTRIKIALDKVLSREPYDLINNSCQTLVNEACTNERKNDDTGKVLFATLGVVLGVALLGSLMED